MDLSNALIKLRPEWASAPDDDPEAEKSKDCVVKVVMTGSAEDGPDWQPHTELITHVRKSVTIDWTLRESARAKIRVMVKRILNKYGYPPDLQGKRLRGDLLFLRYSGDRMAG